MLGNVGPYAQDPDQRPRQTNTMPITAEKRLSPFPDLHHNSSNSNNRAIIVIIILIIVVVIIIVLIIMIVIVIVKAPRQTDSAPSQVQL